MHVIIKAGDQHFLIVRHKARACVIVVDRYSGDLCHHACYGQDLFDSMDEAMSHVLQAVGHADVVKQVAAVLGYVVVGFEGLLLVANTVKATGWFPGPREHVVHTVTAAEWVAIPLLQPLWVFPFTPPLWPAGESAGSPQSDGSCNNSTANPAQALASLITDDGASYAWLAQDRATAKRLRSMQWENTSFYCETLDLTNFWRANFTKTMDGELKPAKSLAPEFQWNEHLARPFIALGMSDLCPVILRGLCTSWPVAGATGATATCTYLMRQSNVHPGPRFLARGLRSAGRLVGAANEYECEQLVYRPDPSVAVPGSGQYLWAHYVWHRGSVPVAWQSVVKAGVEVCQLAPQPYDDVPAYWQHIWKRHNTDNVCCVNLLRQNAATPQTNPNSPLQFPPPLHLPQPGRQRRRSCTQEPTDLLVLGGDSLSAAHTPVDPSAAVDLLVLDIPTVEPVVPAPGPSPIPHEEADWGPFESAPSAEAAELHRPAGIDLVGESSPSSDFGSSMNSLGHSPAAISPPTGVSAATAESATLMPPEAASPCSYEDWSDLGSDEELELPVEDFDTSVRLAEYPVEDVDALANKSGEAKLGHAFEESLATLATWNTRVVHFDWHGAVRRSSPKETVEAFWRLLADQMKAYGVSSGTVLYEEQTATVQRHTRQAGFFRFNCRDSLDRTNLAVFFCIMQVLPQQCLKVGLSIRADGPTGTLTAALQAALTPKHKDNPKGLMCLSASDTEASPSPCASPVNVGKHNLEFPALDELSPSSSALPDEEWPFLQAGISDVHNALQRYPKNILEAIAAAHVTSGDVCATLYAGSPAMHSGLLRSFAGTQVQSAKSNLTIGVGRLYSTLLSDGGKLRGLEELLGRCAADPAARPPRITAEDASRSVLLLTDTPLQRDYLQSVFSCHGGVKHLVVMADANGIPVGPNPEVDRRKSLALLVFEDFAAADQATAEAKHMAVQVERCSTEKYVAIQQVLVKHVVARGQRAHQMNRAKAALQATKNLIGDKLVKARNVLKDPKVKAAQGVAAVSSGLSKAFNSTPMSKLFAKKP